MRKRTASAVWHGGLKGGRGTINVERVGFEVPYTFGSRFEESTGVSPEDLVGAAHAGCFSMALSAGLEKAGFPPDRVETSATVYLEPVEGAQTVTRIELNTKVKAPNLDAEKLRAQADDAKNNCPISRLLKGAQITVNAELA